MKLLLIFLPYVAIYSSKVTQKVPQTNSHYVEGVSRYIWMPDSNNTLHLVDLNDTMIYTSAINLKSIEYWLYTRSNPDDHQLLINGDINSVKKSNYNANHPIKVLVHGWMSDGSAPINTMIKRAILKVINTNVIIVDWSKIAGGWYTATVPKVPEVGRQLGKFLIWLIDNVGGKWNDMHLIGHSLGAHVVGNAGRTTGGRPRRITGLDPAGPLWSANANALNDKDGIYVESIHTDSGRLGLNNPISDVDFYPNGGSNQPGCWLDTCCHSRAFELFASSIGTNHFVGKRCANLSEARNNKCSGPEHRMGNGDLRKRGIGIYALTTGSKWPY